MEQLSIFDYVKQEPDVNVIVQKAPEKPPRSDTI
jgi:hypothetical protein